MARIAWLGLMGLALSAQLANAQPYLPLLVPASQLADSVSNLGAGFEPAWNALLVAHLKARLGPPSESARADSLRQALVRVAAAESLKFATHLVSDELVLLDGWSPAQMAERITAAENEARGSAAEAKARGPDAEAHDAVLADSSYREAAIRYQALSELRREAIVRGRREAVAITAGHYVQADTLAGEALVVRRRLGDERLIGNSLYDLGWANYNLNKLEKARQLLEEARAVRTHTGQKAQLGSTLHVLALALEALGEPDSVEMLVREGLELTCLGGDSLRTAQVLVHLLSLDAGAGRFDEAESVTTRLSALAIDYPSIAPAFLLNVGDLAYAQGRYGTAITSLEHARDVAHASNDRGDEGEALNSLGRTLMVEAGDEVGDEDIRSAHDVLSRTLAFADSNHVNDLAIRALNNLAVCEAKNHRPAAAMLHARQSLDRARAAHSAAREREALVTLGDLEFHRGRYPASEVWLRQAVAVGPRHGEREHVGAATDLGWVVLLLKRFSEADSLFADSGERARRLGLVDLVWPALEGRGEVAQRRGKLLDALDYYRQAAVMVDTVRSRQAAPGAAVTTFAGRLSVFEGLIHFLGQLQVRYPDSTFNAEAFEWAERSRARALKDMQIANGITTEQFVAPRIAEVSMKLAPDEAMLYYSIGDSSSSLWVIRADRWKRLPLPSRATLSPRVHALLNGLASQTTAETPDVSRVSHVLYELLVGHATPMLAGIHRLRIAPDGILATVPFEALRLNVAADNGPLSSTAGSSAPTYMLQRWSAVTYLSSAAALFEAPRAPAPPGFLVVADPRFGSVPREASAGTNGVRSLPRLQWTELEADTLKRLAGKSPCTVLTGSDATRERVLATGALEQARIAHFATHGNASEEDPDASGLWLAADSTGVSTRLTVRDILTLHSQAELVTLSACETGLGRLERGEGVLGLTRAFLAGGTRSVTVSLWSVSDKWTARLMERFYSNLLQRKMPRDLALADAKRHLLNDLGVTSPYYWAPFVLVGETGVLAQ